MYGLAADTFTLDRRMRGVPPGVPLGAQQETPVFHILRVVCGMRGSQDSGEKLAEVFSNGNPRILY
jgi:hypothetical protein